MRKKFSKSTLEKLDVTYKPVKDTMVGRSRWSITHEIIFEYEDKYWRTEYEEGATENQEQDIWGYEDEIECIEVELREVTKKEWFPVED